MRAIGSEGAARCCCVTALWRQGVVYVNLPGGYVSNDVVLIVEESTPFVKRLIRATFVIIHRFMIAGEWYNQHRAAKIGD
jgi:hypothetical protein